ncbi:MAG: endonuclease, partial [Pseudobutyrivibrio sp.]|nr:endonuclease [Pseudobutyrivibrio sp.]
GGSAIDSAKAEDIEHNSCRDAGEPYQEGQTQTYTLDGFIVSDNVGVNYYTNMDWRYELSDHDPVLMQFMLLKSE